MKAIIQAYMPLSGIKEVTTQSVDKEPSSLDRVTVSDRYGSSIQLEVGVILNIMHVLAASKNMSVLEYLTKNKLNNGETK